MKLSAQQIEVLRQKCMRAVERNTACAVYFGRRVKMQHFSPTSHPQVKEFIRQLRADVRRDLAGLHEFETPIPPPVLVISQRV